jgi:hypothetical protein
MNKSFKEYYYLTESKNTYVFKVKLIGDHQADSVTKLKEALSQYKIVSFSEGKSCPIQETQPDFPMHKNVGVTTYEVSLGYPITSPQLAGIISDTLNLPQNGIKVRSDNDINEEEINHEHDQKTGQAYLGTDYEVENNQDLVGEKHVMRFLKELNKEKHQGTQYKGVNDQILAKKVPVDKTISDKPKPVGKSDSPIGSRKVKLPSPKG